MEVRWVVHTGWPSQLGLQRIVSAFTRSDRCSQFKIGITGNPIRRASQYPYAYDEMVVLYKTMSERFVRDTEGFLTDLYWEDCDNSIRGRSGRLSGAPYYLYVVLRHWW